mmetsp:Transcript_24991/g.36897  ORF Transcript_24991/g.36897 Transcript_24991/m.36897 type:complete len:241 (-) Transcript_24991:111-833(-)
MGVRVPLKCLATDTQSMLPSFRVFFSATSSKNLSSLGSKGVVRCPVSVYRRVFDHLNLHCSGDLVFPINSDTFTQSRPPLGPLPSHSLMALRKLSSSSGVNFVQRRGLSQYFKQLFHLSTHCLLFSSPPIASTTLFHIILSFTWFASTAARSRLSMSSDHTFLECPEYGFTSPFDDVFEPITVFAVVFNEYCNEAIIILFFSLISHNSVQYLLVISSDSDSFNRNIRSSSSALSRLRFSL